MHRIYFSINSLEQWYAIIQEANRWFGRGLWRGQSRVRRKFTQVSFYNVWAGHSGYHEIWFDVPNAEFASWVTVKYGIQSRLSQPPGSVDSGT